MVIFNLYYTNPLINLLKFPFQYFERVLIVIVKIIRNILVYHR